MCMVESVPVLRRASTLGNYSEGAYLNPTRHRSSASRKLGCAG
jgi:hypothetical protein